MDKTEIRRAMRSLGPIDSAQAVKVVEHLFRWVSPRLPGTAAAYLAMSDEVDVESLFARLPGWRWVLPRVEGDGSLSFWDRDLEREMHGWGMEQPVASGDAAPLHEVDLILAPGVAFDLNGGRLGRGKGYYDRTLELRRSDCLAVGVTVSSRVLGEVPSQPHDRRVDFLATDDGVVECRSVD